MSKRTSKLKAASKAVDPTLDALFTTSYGPVVALSKSRYSKTFEQNDKKNSLNPNARQVSTKEQSTIAEAKESDTDNDDSASPQPQTQDVNGTTSHSSNLLPSTGENAATHVANAVELLGGTRAKQDRKRKRKEEHDNIEGAFFDKLDHQTRSQSATKHRKTENDEEASTDSNEDAEVSYVHESLAKGSPPTELDKAERTVFLANVSSEAISSRSAKKALIAHLSTVLKLDADPPELLESLRFRSVAFSTGSMPKRGAYITKSLMDSTTKATNAYAVYPSPAAAQAAVKQLNGSEVLARHIRVDSVAHPSPTDHRRCVFVGNLGFVDDETVMKTNANGENVERKRNKIPSDIEEGLWRTFGTKGKVENVRVVRDPQTRVGKGFAYVQFYDGNDVEAALLLNEKKFPPLLPRALRVTRAKDPRKTALAQERSQQKTSASKGPNRSLKHRPKLTAEAQSAAGRANKLLGRVGAILQQRGGTNSTQQHDKAAESLKTPQQIVFEGKRTSSRDGRPKDLKFGKKSKGKARIPKSRGAKRAAEWRKKK